MKLPHLLAALALAALATSLFFAPGVRAQETQTAALEPNAQPLGREELDQLVAPVALYSDKLLAQVFMASTYPLEVVEAERWAREHSSLKGDALMSAVEKERWDASVKALVQVPQVLKMMSDKLDWTQRLGDAFLAQQKDVMDAVQRLRQMADKAGNLKSGEQQTIVREPAPAPAPSGGTTTVVESAPSETIIIQDTSPEVVYVPDYNPSVAYGAWPYPAYPPYYWGAGYYGAGYGYAPFGGALAWGVGMGISAAVWDDAFDWGGGDINVNNSFNRNTNWQGGDRNRVNHRGGDKWRHDPSHRRGANYRDQGSRDRFAKGDRNADARRDFRGRDGARGGRGDTPRLSDRDMNRGRDGNRAGNRGGRDQVSNRAGRDGNRAANRGGRDQVSNRAGRDGNRAANRGGNRSNQYGNRGGSRDYGNRGAGSRQYGNRGGGSRYGQGSYGGRGAASRGYGGGGRHSYGGGGRGGGYSGVGRGGQTRNFSNRGGGSRGGMRGGRGGGGRRR